MRSSEGVNWPFIGTWRLVSYEFRDQAGEVQYPFGPDAVGQLMYDVEGNMSAFVGRASVAPFASGDWDSGTDAEVRAAYDGFVGYFGTYSFDLNRGTVIHHVRSASFPNWTDTDQVRYFKVKGQRLALSAPIIVDGRDVSAVLIWERARDLCRE